MGLIVHETKIYNIFEEAYQIMLPIKLREFFASFLLCESIKGFTMRKIKNIFHERLLKIKNISTHILIKF